MGGGLQHRGVKQRILARKSCPAVTLTNTQQASPGAALARASLAAAGGARSHLGTHLSVRGNPRPREALSLGGDFQQRKSLGSSLASATFLRPAAGLAGGAEAALPSSGGKQRAPLRERQATASASRLGRSGEELGTGTAKVVPSGAAEESGVGAEKRKRPASAAACAEHMSMPSGAKQNRAEVVACASDDDDFA